jgi:uncharacterized membrane protein YbhN (UPF0104 family)
VPNSETTEPRSGLSPRLRTAIRVAGILIACLAVALCARTLIHEWHTVRHAVTHVRVGLLVVAFIAAALAMAGLAVLWWRCLKVFGAQVPLSDATAWYFAGELGKYLPGGVWQVLGRGELAQRSGRVNRGVAYTTTLIGYATMCIGGAVVCGVLSPALALDDRNLRWTWVLLALIPAAALLVHPTVFGAVLNLVRRATRNRVSLETPSWRRMLELIAYAIPTWVLVGLSSVLVTSALGFHQNPARVAFAAVAAWIIGFLAVPVPAGAGIRELVFVAIAGLGGAPGIAVAAGSRALLIAVDGIGGIGGLLYARRSARKSARKDGSGGAHRKIQPAYSPG